MSDAKRATSSVAAEVDEQRGSNASAVAHFDAFAAHREKLTELVLSGVSREAGLRLCVLGAGNCYDLDLARLAGAFREIHLVDLDPAALVRAAARLDEAPRGKIVPHAPLDLSGMLDRLEQWKAFQVQPQELMEHPARASQAVVERLPGPFDVVLSSCVLSQMHLTILNVLSSQHRLFEAARHLLNLAHLRTLAALLAPGGRGLLVTDVATDADHPFGSVAADFDGRALLAELMTAGRAISAVRPDLLAWTAREDPMLKERVTLSAPVDAWLWHNGPERIFLVYAMELRPTAGS
jgi:hypothetical protein